MANTVARAISKSPKKLLAKKAVKPAAKAKQPAPVVSTGFWLMKSEPEAYSIDDFKRDGKTLWTGVRNYQARNFMMTSMKPGDQILFYHSNAEPSGVAGLGVVLRTNLPDPSALDAKSEYHDPKASTDHPIWFCAEVGFKEKFDDVLSLNEIREMPALQDMLLLRKGQRLSIQPVTVEEFKTIVKVCGGSTDVKSTPLKMAKRAN